MREMGRRAGGDGVHGLGRAAGMGKWHATHQGVWMREASGVSALRFGAAGGLGRGGGGPRASSMRAGARGGGREIAARCICATLTHHNDRSPLGEADHCFHSGRNFLNGSYTRGVRASIR